MIVYKFNLQNVNSDIIFVRMGYLVLILLIAILAITILGYVIAERNNNASRRSFQEISRLAKDNFNITHSVKGFKDKYLFIVDKESHNVIVMRSISDVKTIPFSNIEGVELRMDEKVIGSSNICSAVGAVVGGNLIGTSGAIFGALSMALRNRRGISRISVSIRNRDYSYTTLLCLDAWEASDKTKKYLRANDWAYKREYQEGVQRAKRIIEVIIPIIENNYKHLV